MIHPASRERQSAPQSHGQGSSILDLTYLGTGSFQHVFTESGATDDSWVYKVPAAFGYIVPYTPPRSLLTPHNLYEHALKLTLIRLPDAICRRVSRVSARYRNPQRLGSVRSPLALLEQFCGMGQAMGRQLVAAYARPRRRRKFESMLGVLQYIVDRGLGDIPLPFEVVDSGEAVLRVNGEAQPYQGPILVQRRATCLFEGDNGFRSLDWTDVVVSLERLWRVGVGLSDMFKPWAVLDGHARLFDTSGLTRDVEKLRRHMSEEHLERRQQIALREWAHVSGDGSASEYCRFLRAKLTQERLRQLWRIDLTPGSVDHPTAGEGREETGA